MVHLLLVLMAILKSNNSNKNRLTISIADLINSEGLPFNIYQKTRFKKILELTRKVSRTSITPNKNLISKELLNLIHKQNMKRNLAMIKKEAYISGLLFFRRWCHNFKMSIVKYSGFWENIPVAFLKIVDCQGHLSDGNKKYRTFICNQCLNNMK